MKFIIGFIFSIILIITGISIGVNVQSEKIEKLIDKTAREKYSMGFSDGVRADPKAIRKKSSDGSFTINGSEIIKYPNHLIFIDNETIEIYEELDYRRTR